jgi:hypothetical protein
VNIPVLPLAVAISVVHHHALLTVHHGRIVTVSFATKEMHHDAGMNE